jgi:hypothetical protein
MSTTIFSRDSLESMNVAWNTPQSALPQPQYGNDPSPLSPLAEQGSEHSLNSETSLPRLPYPISSNNPLLTPSSAQEESGRLGPRGRASSEITVNNNIPVPTPMSASATGASSSVLQERERESSLFEITEEEMTGGYLARSVIAPGTDLSHPPSCSIS